MIDRDMSRHKRIVQSVHPDALEGLPSPTAQREYAWRSLYDESFNSIYRYVCCSGILPGDVEDVTQRVFLVAYRRIRESTKVENPKAWLRGIATRVISEHQRWRRVRRLKSWLLRSTVDASTQTPRTPEGAFASAEAQHLVRAVLARMRPKLREVLVLLDLDEHSPQEVALILRIPVNTVRSRKRLARQEFLRLWRKHGEAHG